MTKQLTIIDPLKDRYIIRLGDCIEKMKQINNNSIDLLLTDPPYNLGLFMQNRDTNMGKLRSNHFSSTNWDHIEQSEWEKNIDKFLSESSRVLKKRGALIIFMSLIKVETVIKLAEKNGFYYKTTGVWHKKNPMPRNMNLHFVNSTEAWIYFINNGKTGTFNNKGKIIHDFYESSNISVREKKHGKHPTQKPIALMEHFIELLSNKDDVVLDPFMGSGSAGIASLNKNRKFYGIEIDKNYYNLSKKRILDIINTK